MEVMRKHVLPLTYPPKIPAVLKGECTQSIREGQRFSIGDLIMFHGWEGKPYRSKWSFRTPYWPIWYNQGILVTEKGWFVSLNHKGNLCSPVIPWENYRSDMLAAMDGIVPATGKELYRVLSSMHKIPVEGLRMQIVRWDQP
jgi:hypothetical protein